MPPVSDRDRLRDGDLAGSRAVPGSRAAPARRPRARRPPAALAAVTLLCVAWAAAAVLLLSVLASVRARAWPLRVLDALVPGPAGPRDASPGASAGTALCAMLLVAGVLLVYAVPELLYGNRTARVMVGIGTPLLVAEPVRRAVLTLGEEGADVTVAWCTLAIAATALLAAALSAVPSTGGTRVSRPA